MAVLDLYAGSGALGIDAASRGARRLVLVENDPAALRAIEHNLSRASLTTAVEVLRGDAAERVVSLHRDGEEFDVVYADPPYDAGEVERILRALAAAPLVATGGVIVIEHSPRERGPDRAGTLQRMDERRYGQTSVSFFEPASSGSNRESDSDDARGDPP